MAEKFGADIAVCRPPKRARRSFLFPSMAQCPIERFPVPFFYGAYRLFADFPRISPGAAATVCAAAAL